MYIFETHLNTQMEEFHLFQKKNNGGVSLCNLCKLLVN